MKKIILVLLGLVFLFSTTCWAGSSITFGWDANLEKDLAGYRLYQSDTSGKYLLGEKYAIATIPAGTEEKTLPNVPDGVFFFVLTAYDDHRNESGKSNEVSTDLDTVPPKAPGLKVTAIENGELKITVEIKPPIIIK